MFVQHLIRFLSHQIQLDLYIFKFNYGFTKEPSVSSDSFSSSSFIKASSMFSPFFVVLELILQALRTGRYLLHPFHLVHFPSQSFLGIESTYSNQRLKAKPNILPTGAQSVRILLLSVLILALA